jgi:hypothetical protein
MRIAPPEKVTKTQVTFDVAEIEPFLTAPAMPMKPWPNATITLKDGKTMFIRAARKEEVPLMLPYMKKLMDVDYDFYDIVGVRVYAELLGWYRNRLKDPYVILGLIDGELVGLANGRMWNKDINISHHTMTFVRRGQIGAIMYYCKIYYALEILGCQEFWSTFESYNGWRLGFQTRQPTYTWPEHQHELGGAQIYYVNQEHWNSMVKGYLAEQVGADLVFDNIPEALVQINYNMRVPEEVAV